jgi:hypothetical protein
VRETQWDRPTVWHGATENCPLNDGQIPNPNVVRVVHGTRYHRVEGNRRASRNGPVSDPPPETPQVTIRNFFVAVHPLSPSELPNIGPTSAPSLQLPIPRHQHRAPAATNHTATYVRLPVAWKVPAGAAACLGVQFNTGAALKAAWPGHCIARTHFWLPTQLQM